MKVKALKAHYYDGSYVLPGMVYRADKVHADVVIRRGLCESAEPEIDEKDLSHVIELEDKNAAPKRTKKRPARRKTKK